MPGAGGAGRTGGAGIDHRYKWIHKLMNVVFMYAAFGNPAARAAAMVKAVKWKKWQLESVRGKEKE